MLTSDSIQRVKKHPPIAPGTDFYAPPQKSHGEVAQTF